MNKIKKLLNFTPLFLLLAIVMVSIAWMGNEPGGKGKGNRDNVYLKAGDAYTLNINKIVMPMNREGVLANVSVAGQTEGGRMDGKIFLFSGGFFMSGLNNGVIWANGVASASRIQDYAPGNTEFGRNDSRAQLYVINQLDEAFGQSWLDWKDAVDLGAYFYDGDGDGVYNPVDLNGNGKWDEGEDHPDILGNETVWCVYHDGIDPALRRFNDVEPQGIDMRQTVFAFQSSGIVGNMIFIRYSILNTGSVAQSLDSVYLGVWADPDLGDGDGVYDDLVGCDTLLNAGFVYNDGDDADWGANPPTFLIDFFQGPIQATGDMNDTAYNVQGQIRGIDTIPGSINLGLSSFVHYIQSHPTHGDPNTRFEIRNYMLGFNREGDALDPCTWAFGEVMGSVNCAAVDPKFSYSGDPVTQEGWIHTGPDDQRQMSNTGPFTLNAGEPVDIVVAYVVAKSENGALGSVTLAKEYSVTAQLVFDNNFPSPPPPPPLEVTTKTGPGFIDIQWPTYEQVQHRAVDSILDVDRRLQGFYVTAFRANLDVDVVDGVTNSVRLGYWEIDNDVNQVYVANRNGGSDLAFDTAAADKRLDSTFFADPNSGRIRLRVQTDPFTGEALVKGHEYYFKVTPVYLNHKAIFEYTPWLLNDTLVNTGADTNYIDINYGGGIEEFPTKLFTVVYGQDMYEPGLYSQTGNQTTGNNDGEISYVVVNNDQLTGNTYEVEFFQDTNATLYSTFCILSNKTSSTVLDTFMSESYSFDTTNYAGDPVDGFLLRVKPVVPAAAPLAEQTYIPETNKWTTNFFRALNLGAYYMGEDMKGDNVESPLFSNKRSEYTNASMLRQIEIRFDSQNPGKAYRYLNGFGASILDRRRNYVYAEGITAADTAGTNGNLQMFGMGFVDVPFTAWVKDDRFGEERQLAVGFIEVAQNFTAGENQGGIPNGIWDPDTAVEKTKEVIVIFDSDYDPTGSQIQYTGGTFGSETIWADINSGFDIPAGASGVTEEQRKIAASPFFDAIYVVSLERMDMNAFFTDGDKLVIPVETYPYATNDKFEFTTTQGGALTEDDARKLFEKVNVYPNPLFAYNPAYAYDFANPDEPFVTFTNLPTEITVKIFTLSGMLVRTLTEEDKSTPTSPFLEWDLQNEDELRVASGMYLAIIDSEKYGQKVLKFAIIMPQKQIQRY